MKFIRFFRRLVDRVQPITHERLVAAGYKPWDWKKKQGVAWYYCPPDIDCGRYRLAFDATQFKGGGAGTGAMVPVEGTEEWRAYLTSGDLPTIRRFKTMGELSDFHVGMGGRALSRGKGVKGEGGVKL